MKNRGRRPWDQNHTKLKSPTLFSYRHLVTKLPQPLGDSFGSSSNSCDSSAMPSSVTNEPVSESKPPEPPLSTFLHRGSYQNQSQISSPFIAVIVRRSDRSMCVIN
ncbi:hypothetical protein M0R45_037168 [Rubus argutus]|uniref:Uncharacterized protein n=1 Tax=Rubus argutus TaxID=59490 RepID=A0AAW1VZH9_RUBAR